MKEQSSHIVAGCVLVGLIAAGYGVSTLMTSKQAEMKQADLPKEALPGLSDSVSGLQGELAADLPYDSRFGQLPGTLEGTEFIAPLAVDENGHLRVSGDIRQAFDYFLSAIDEEPLDSIVGRINEYLDYSLKEPALSEAKAILLSYLELKQALYDFETARAERFKGVMEEGASLQDPNIHRRLLEEQFLERNRLRAEYLSPEVHEAFYGREEAYDEYTLARIRVLNDDSLSAEARASALDTIDSQAPEHVTLARKEARIVDTLQERTAEIQAAGGSQEDIRALRTDMFGAEAAERFEQLDQRRAEWQQRVDDYLAQRQSILSYEGISMEERNAQIDQLRESLFDAREQIRVRTFERQADKSGINS